MSRDWPKTWSFEDHGKVCKIASCGVAGAATPGDVRASARDAQMGGRDAHLTPRLPFDSLGYLLVSLGLFRRWRWACCVGDFAHGPDTFLRTWLLSRWTSLMERGGALGWCGFPARSHERGYVRTLRRALHLASLETCATSIRPPRRTFFRASPARGTGGPGGLRVCSGIRTEHLFSYPCWDRERRKSRRHGIGG
jgi:hypothetical protein